MTVRVLIADDNPVVRVGLASLLELEDDIEVCAEAGNGREALDRAREVRPDVVLLDVRMPGTGGLEVLAELAAISKVLMLTYSDEPAVVSRALSSGATGYLVHGAFDSTELAVAIRDTAVGGVRLSPPAAAVLVSGVTGGAVAEQAPAEERTIAREVVTRFRLSRREEEIGLHMVRGLTNGEIASALYIEEKTVKNHINRLFAKLGVASRPAAIAMLLGIREH